MPSRLTHLFASSPSAQIGPTHHQYHQLQTSSHRQSAMRETTDKQEWQSNPSVPQKGDTSCDNIYRLEYHSQMRCGRVMQIIRQQFAGCLKPCWFCHVWSSPLQTVSTTLHQQFKFVSTVMCMWINGCAFARCWLKDRNMTVFLGSL